MPRLTCRVCHKEFEVDQRALTEADPLTGDFIAQVMHYEVLCEQDARRIAGNIRERAYIDPVHAELANGD